MVLAQAGKRSHGKISLSSQYTSVSDLHCDLASSECWCYFGREIIVWHNEIIISDTQYHISNICNRVNWMWRNINWMQSHMCFTLFPTFDSWTCSNRQLSTNHRVHDRCNIFRRFYDEFLFIPIFKSVFSITSAHRFFYFFINGFKSVAVPTASFTKSNSQSFWSFYKRNLHSCEIFLLTHRMHFEIALHWPNYKPMRMSIFVLDTKICA